MAGARARRTCLGWQAALAPWLLALACDGPASAPGAHAGPQQTTCPIASAVVAPSFRGHVLPIFTQSCGAGSAISCHGPGAPVGHVSFDPALGATAIRASLVGVDPSNAPTGWKRVAPADVAHSWLVEKVTKDDPGGVGQAYGNRMPYGLPNLCDATVQTIVNWIALGAAND